MSKGKGWILVYRSLQDHWLWDEKPFGKGQAWIDLLFLANHEPHKTRVGDKFIECGRGQVNRSYRWLAEAWGWSTEKVRRFIKLLEKDGMVTVLRDTNVTVITIENYDCYQFDPRGNETESRHYRDTTETEARSEREHTKNVKNEKNEINVNNNTYIAPTLDDVIQYASMNGFKSDPRKFFDYYASRDWKTKNGTPIDNWETCFDAWERRDKSEVRNADIHSSSISEEVARGTRPDYRIKPDRPL